MISTEKYEEFSRLYMEFVKEYLTQDAGRRHREYYIRSRQDAHTNFNEINKAHEQGDDVTDQVLLKLLPYQDTPHNREHGAWIHVAPCITKDIKFKYERAGWVRSEDWPAIAQAILKFINCCIADPIRLKECCDEFAELPNIKGFQSGMLTPILNALVPNEFVLINNKSRKLINYFANSNFSQSLMDYSEINRVAKDLIEELSPVLGNADEYGIKACDLFDVFSHWLITIRKYPFDLTESLGDNFNLLFGNREDALFAFEWFENAASTLQIYNADDPSSAVTFYDFPAKTLF